MKFLIILSTLFILSSNEPCFVVGRGYKGYIFHESHFVMVSVEQQKSRYTPTSKDVEIAEQLLREQLSGLNKSHANQSGSCPIIDKKLQKYKRQYVGFINEKGEKILWINCIWSKELESQLSLDIISVKDGCSYYWSIKVNITTAKAYELDINGSA
jgi:hypothetical protein